MNKIIIRPVSKLTGEIKMPGDKSISHRAVIVGAMAKGQTMVRGLLDCDDCNFTIGAFRQMGIPVEKRGEVTIIDGKGLKGLGRPAKAINVGNSGTSMRLLAGILAGQDFESVLEGSEGLSRRPMKRIVEPLSLMGADIKANDGGYPPISIKGGRLEAIDYKMPVSSAQVKSAILLAGLYTDGVTRVEEVFKSRDHTERMLKYFGADLRIEGAQVSIKGSKELASKTIEIPGDISSAAFFLVGAAILKGSGIKIKGVGINPARAGILEILTRMGAGYKLSAQQGSFEPSADIEMASCDTRGVTIDKDLIPALIDELPIIFVLASVSKGRTVIRGIEELRVKETDRINSMKENLEKMGVRIEVKGDDIIIYGVANLKAAKLKSFGDHRTCMAMTIAALSAEGESEIDDIDCVSKSFPGFFDVLKSLKA
jgi:3-phosphoshikimate 1-carboxyvinyltransferase